MQLIYTVKDILKKNDIIYLLYRYRKDEEFRKWIKLYHSPEVLQYYRLGDKNPNRSIYLMYHGSDSWGFFAGWKFVLQGVAYAEYYHLTPVVYWTEKNPYYEEGYSENNNPWEYFFEPVSDISVEDARCSEKVVVSKNTFDRTSVFLDSSYENSYDLVSEYAKYNKKYIRIKGEIKTKILKECQELLGKEKVIAVHVRGVEWGNIAGHPEPLQLSEYYKVLDIALYAHGFSKIFLATDSEDTAASFKAKYGDKVVMYTDVLRSSKGSKTLMLFDSNVTRENNHFLMGYEVLRDMLTMSACEGLIAGWSNISLAAMVFKATNGEEYEFMNIMTNQKVVKKGISSIKAVKMMKNNKFR